MEENKVIFTTENDEQVEFYILEQTKLNGFTYLLVTDAQEDDEEGNAYILKDLSTDADDAALYDMIEDEKELELIGNIFEELVDDIELEIE
jgi:hypothetical protein